MKPHCGIGLNKTSVYAITFGVTLHFSLYQKFSNSVMIQIQSLPILFYTLYSLSPY
jgi:hypothetical protein